MTDTIYQVNANVSDHAGRTPLHEATERGLTPTLQALIRLTQHLSVNAEASNGNFISLHIKGGGLILTVLKLIPGVKFPKYA